MLQLSCNKTTQSKSMRRPLALVLLCAYAAAAVHLALGAHAVTDSGAVVEAQPLCEQNHGAAGIEHGHQLNGEESECQAAALVRTAARTPSGAALVTGPAAPHPALLVEARATPPLGVLSVAPKSSPPV